MYLRSVISTSEAHIIHYPDSTINFHLMFLIFNMENLWRCVLSMIHGYLINLPPILLVS